MVLSPAFCESCDSLMRCKASGRQRKAISGHSFHIEKTLAGARNFFGGRTKEAPAFYRPQQSVEFSHAPELGVHGSKFSHRAVCDRLALRLAGIFGK